QHRHHSGQGLECVRGLAQAAGQGHSGAAETREYHPLLGQLMAAVTPPRPLTEDDDRSQFDCGRDSLNGWFRRHAWANQESGASRVNVITEAATGRIV